MKKYYEVTYRFDGYATAIIYADSEGQAEHISKTLDDNQFLVEEHNKHLNSIEAISAEELAGSPYPLI